MKILLYSDVHISRTSSIFPTTYKDTNYTYRQMMLKQTGQWLSVLAKQNNPNLIINLGDTFDQHTLTSYDTEIARQFFSEFSDINIPHFVLIGNHEMINEEFNAVAMLDNVSNITIIKDPTSLQFKDSTLAFLPYRHTKDIIDLPKGDFLFSHNDIYGSPVRGTFKLEAGISPALLKQNYKLVFNGHIHKSSMFENIINVGSCTTHSFSDDNNWEPHAYLFDTETLNLETFTNTFCPLFKTFDIKSLEDFNQVIAGLNKNRKYILHITCPFEIKDEVKSMLETYKTINTETEKDQEFIINSKLNVKVQSQNNKQLLETKQINNNIKTNLDVTKSFNDFLELTDLKFPKQLYIDVVNNKDVNIINKE